MNSRKSLIILLLILFLLILSSGLFYFLISDSSGNVSSAIEYAAEKRIQITEEKTTTAGEDDPFASTVVPERFIVDHHTVVENESFSLVTGQYWDDVYLWPDLYIRNKMESEDPDIIYPEEIIDIYNRLGKGDLYDEIEKDEILKAYIEVYDIYKKLGPEKENSVWALLYSGAKYDHDFLQIFSNRIEPADRAMAQKYIDEEGYLD
ncbi:MAG: hypothetical protein GY786_06940 [Proteobacteria bacterium]|nr:hypothetical protein [Pseudomonadota bacterium]